MQHLEMSHCHAVHLHEGYEVGNLVFLMHVYLDYISDRTVSFLIGDSGSSNQAVSSSLSSGPRSNWNE